MQVSENQTEISYDAAVKELELPLEELEPFIIEGMFHGPTFHHPDLSCDTRVVS